MMQIREKLKNWIKKTVKIENDFVLAHPKEIKNGDYSFFNHSPTEANDFSRVLSENKIAEVDKVEVAGNFVNIYLSKNFFAESVEEINKKGTALGRSSDKPKKVLIEHTQPNPFKKFHVGHLMNNAIGESIARIVKANKAETKTASYHGDKGLHVAKWVWATQKGIEYEEAYAHGNKAYEEDENAKHEIIGLNKDIYEGKIKTVWDICNKGFNKFKNDFEAISKRLDSHFDYQFWETAAGEKGKEIIEKHIKDGIFEKSEGAVVFRGEKYGLHTRVFINSDGLPTYEAKEVGLASIKNSLEHFDESITITGNEQDAFFRVTEAAIGQVIPELRGKIIHLSHGMLKLPTGKMSSRTGEVITAENLIEQVKEKVLTKIADRGFSPEEKKEIAEIVTIGAIKYSILRQAIGGDIVFDFDKSISFEGDSGPYLQYTAVRANSVLEKSKFQISNFKSIFKFLNSKIKRPEDFEITELEKYLYRFPEIVERAGEEYAPHYIVTYLTELASIFNGFYAKNKIIDESDSSSPYKVALTRATANILTSGLSLLGIKVPTRM